MELESELSVLRQDKATLHARVIAQQEEVSLRNSEHEALYQECESHMHIHVSFLMHTDSMNAVSMYCVMLDLLFCFLRVSVCVCVHGIV